MFEAKTSFSTVHFVQINSIYLTHAVNTTVYAVLYISMNYRNKLKKKVQKSMQRTRYHWARWIIVFEPMSSSTNIKNVVHGLYTTCNMQS